MKTICLSAAALFALACAACHSEPTRDKIVDMESRAASNHAATSVNDVQPPQ